MNRWPWHSDTNFSSHITETLPQEHPMLPASGLLGTNWFPGNRKASWAAGRVGLGTDVGGTDLDI